MSKRLLKWAILFNVIVMLFSLVLLSKMELLEAILFAFFGAIPFIANIACTCIMGSYLKDPKEKFVTRGNSLLILGIVQIVVAGSLISGILTLVASSKASSYEETDEDKEEVDSETRRLDILLKLGVILVTLSGVMFATSSWDILSGGIKTIGLLLFSIFFFLLSLFAGSKLKIKKTEITYYSLSNLFLVITLIAAGFYAVFGNWFSFVGDGFNLYMALIFTVLTILMFVMFKKYNYIEILYLVYTSFLIAVSYLLMQFGIELKFVVLAWSVLSIALTFNTNDTSIYTKTLNNFGRLLIAGLFLIVCTIIAKEPFMWVNILSGILLIGAGYLQVFVKNNVAYKVATPIFASLFSFYALNLADLPEIPTMLIAVLIPTLLYLIGFLGREDKVFYLSSFWTTALVFLVVYFEVVYGNVFILLLLSTVLILLNALNMVDDIVEGHTKLEDYSQPIKLVLLINAITLLISQNIRQVEGDILLLSIGLVFVIGYFMQRDKSIKNLYFYGSLFATLIYYFEIIYLDTLVTSFVVGTINIAIVALLTLIAFRSDKNDNKYKLKEAIYAVASLIAFTNIISMTYHYELLLLGVLISAILFIMLSLIFFNNRYLVGTSLIMLCFTTRVLFSGVLPLGSKDVSVILGSLIWFVMVFIFVHAILGEADKKFKDILEIIAISFIFLLIIFDATWVVGTYIGILCIAFILRGVNSKYIAYFYTGIVFTILNILIQFKTYWEKIPAWGYILVGGLILIGFVTYREYKKAMGKDKAKEVTEEAPEEVSDTPVTKAVSDNVIIISILIMIFALFNFAKLQNNISKDVEKNETSIVLED